MHAHITCSIYRTRSLVPNFAIWNVLISSMTFAFCFQMNILLSEMEKKTWSAENMKKTKNIFGVQLLRGCDPAITLPFCFAIPVLYKQWSIDTVINALLFYCLGSLQTSRGVSLLATSSGVTNHGSSNTTMSVLAFFSVKIIQALQLSWCPSMQSPSEDIWCQDMDLSIKKGLFIVISHGCCCVVMDYLWDQYKTIEGLACFSVQL